jgi:hypothetical protein
VTAQSSAPGFLFSKQSRPGPVTVTTKFLQAVEPHQERCEVCERIDDREQMHPTGYDEWHQRVRVRRSPPREGRERMSALDRDLPRVRGHLVKRQCEGTTKMGRIPHDTPLDGRAS